MEAFSALLALCEGKPSVNDEFPSQGPVTWSFGVFFDLRLNKRLSKQWRHRWFETPSRSLWRHHSVVGTSLPDQAESTTTLYWTEYISICHKRIVWSADRALNMQANNLPSQLQWPFESTDSPVVEITMVPILQWRHIENHTASTHQHIECMFNR